MRNLLFLVFVVPVMAIVTQADDGKRTGVTKADVEKQWYYPSSGAESRDEVTNGKAGRIFARTLSTPDKVEDVVLWYGKQIGLSDDHVFMAAAASGYSGLENQRHAAQHVYNHTDQQRNTTLILTNAGPKDVHVAIYHQFRLDAPQSMTISIAKTSTGTSIIVVYPEP